MCEKEVLDLIDYLYGPNKPPNEPKYKRRQERIERVCSIYGDDGEHLKTGLEHLLEGYAVENRTDWNYDSCFSFLVLLHKGIPYPRGSLDSLQLVQKLGGTAYFLSFEISAMGPYCTYSFPRWIYDNSRQELIGQIRKRPFSADHKAILKRVMSYCEGKEFKTLDKDLLDWIVPGITLELAEEEGKVTVYNCLFMDLPPD